MLTGPHSEGWRDLLSPADIGAGTIAALGAAWISLRLLPPDQPRRTLHRWGRCLLLAPRIAWQTLRAGIEVAWWAVLPTPPLRPGPLSFEPRSVRGSRRELFAAISSLVPGTLPIATDERTILYHCLDLRRPVALDLAHDEERLLKALGEPAPPGGTGSGDAIGSHGGSEPAPQRPATGAVEP